MLPIHGFTLYLKGARILLIDDSEPFQRLTTEMLKKSGVASVTAASTLTDGMRFMHYNCNNYMDTPQFDLIMMDINLPDGNGMEGCQFITVHAASYDIPVVVISGTSSAEIIHNVFKAGASDYLQKPLVADLLKARLGMLLKLRTVNYLDSAMSL